MSAVTVRALLAAVGLAAVFGPAAAQPASAPAEGAPAASAPPVDTAPSASASAVAAPAASAPRPALPPATVQQPRSFGHVLGDVLTQRVRLAAGMPDPPAAALPPADRVGLYLERRAPRVETDADGQRWLVLDYQVINAPRALTALALPAWSLPTGGGALGVPAWPISVGPITPDAAFQQGDLQALRPDRPVAPLPTAALQRQLTVALAVLATVLALWAAWWAWRNAREAQRLPFARAWGQVRRLDPSSPDAWLALHHALNATAGHAVQGRTLPRLLDQAPHLRPLASPLQAFFQHSEQRFFATAPAAAPDFALRDLARALREAERRHHA